MNRSVIGFLAFVVALVLAVGFIWPKANTIRDIGVEEQAKREISKTKQERLAALTTLSQTFAANSTKIDTLVSILPSTPEIPEALVTVEAMARANGIEVKSLTPQNEELKQSVLVTLIGSGELTGIEGFISNVADNNRPISVNSVTLVKSIEGNRIDMSIGLNFPYRSTKSGSTP